MESIIKSFPKDSHPMGVLVSTIAALGTFIQNLKIFKVKKKTIKIFAD